MDHSFPDSMIEVLGTSKKVVAMTGAGVSAESGVPTFRDAQTGLWAQYDPTELATPEAFERDPTLVWDWYQWRREKVAEVQPNQGHSALVEMELLFPEFHLITQNIDGLHQLAGSKNVVELHGSIVRAKCFDCDYVADEYPDDTDQRPPKCDKCGGRMRPDVVWFSEALPETALYTAQALATSCDVFFSIGTSSVVHPAAALAFAAAECGATVIEVNPNPTPLSDTANFCLQGPSGEVLPKLVDGLRSRKNDRSSQDD